jgi:hypothetical protein
VVAVNYSSDRNQCYLNLPFHEMDNNTWLFKDLMRNIIYEMDGHGLHNKGLYLDEPAWKFYIFSLGFKTK